MPNSAFPARKSRKKEKNNPPKKFLLLGIGASVFFVDRLLKGLILRNFQEGAGFPVVQGVFHITRVSNTGAAFGLFKNSATALVALSLASLVFLLIFFVRSSGLLKGAALSFVIGGAVGNLYDRWRYGYVVDFLDFRVWPVFNLADSFVCVGVFLVFLGLVKK